MTPSFSLQVGDIKPRAFTLELTKGCNLRCAYCYFAERENAYQPSTKMTAETARRSVDLLVQEGPAGEPVHLHFFGGEPLLNFPLLEETVLYGERRARECGKSITFEVTTNGTLFTDDVVSFLNEHRVHVGVSFDGPPDVQNRVRAALGRSSFDSALPGIRLLLESRRGSDLEAKTHCSAVVTRGEPDLLRIATFLEDLGFSKILLTPVTDRSANDHGFRDEELPRLLEAVDALAADYESRMMEGRAVPVRWFPVLMGRVLSGERRTAFCAGGRDYLGVAADGKIHLCYRFYENDEFSMGSVQEGIDRGVTQRLAQTSMETRTTCSKCWARHFCGGGCHHDNVMEGGALDQPNPVACDVFRHGMGRTLDAWGRLRRAGRLRPCDPSSVGAAILMNDTQAFRDGDRPLRSTRCHVRELDGGRIVYEPSTHEVVDLNETAAFIFERCDGTRTVAELLAELERRYDAPGEVLRKDLHETLRELRSKAILE